MFQCISHSWYSKDEMCPQCIKELYFIEDTTTVKIKLGKGLEVDRTPEELLNLHNEWQKCFIENLLKKAEGNIPDNIKEKVKKDFDAIDLMYNLLSEKNKEIERLKGDIKIMIELDKVRDAMYRVKNNL